jgi:MarR family 2-MHQ and catechol resistance regulon transcriptional repressor
MMHFREPIMSASRLQRELKKRRPFDSAEQEAALNLFRASDRLQHQFAQLFRAHDLSGAQYNILRILRGAGEPLPILEIAARMVAVVPGITGLVDRLEKAGLVERRRCTDDRRVIFVAATAKATELLAKLDEPVTALHKQLLGNLNKSELKELIRLLEKIREGGYDNVTSTQSE